MQEKVQLEARQVCSKKLNSDRMRSQVMMQQSDIHQSRAQLEDKKNEEIQIQVQSMQIKPHLSFNFSERNREKRRTLKKVDRQLQFSREMKRSNPQKNKEEISFEMLKPQKSVYENIKKKKKQECPVCFVHIDQQDFVEFSPDCKHSFCKQCIGEYANDRIKKYQEIKCLEATCSQILKQNCIFYNSLTLQQRERYYKILIFHSVSRSPNQRLCPKEDCQGYIIIDQEPIICVVCGIEYCSKCLMRVHSGQCEQNGMDFLKNTFLYKKCKKCQFVVQKNRGCNHITCLCGNEFCYICEKSWRGQHDCPLFDRQSQSQYEEVPRILLFDRFIYRPQNTIQPLILYWQEQLRLPDQIHPPAQAAHPPAPVLLPQQVENLDQNNLNTQSLSCRKICLYIIYFACLWPIDAFILVLVGMFIPLFYVTLSLTLMFYKSYNKIFTTNKICLILKIIAAMTFIPVLVLAVFDGQISRQSFCNRQLLSYINEIFELSTFKVYRCLMWREYRGQ